MSRAISLFIVVLLTVVYLTASVRNITVESFPPAARLSEELLEAENDRRMKNVASKVASLKHVRTRVLVHSHECLQSLYSRPMHSDLVVM